LATTSLAEPSIRITDCCGKGLGERDFARGGAGLGEMAAWLTSISGAEPSAIRVAIEMPHGLIVETLLEHGFNVYAINPKQLDRFRDRFSPAAAKDDSRDAELLAGQALRGQLHARGDSNLYPRIQADDALT
jgi:hypothetical protein